MVSCFDSNGRVSWVSRERTETECISSTIGAGKSWYADGVSYAPHGGLKGLTLGNGLAEGAVFNNRMQVGEMTLGSGGSVWKLVNEYTRTGVVNNGNVWKQRLTIPGKPVIVTAFDYDGVNRLTVAEEGPANENAAACTGAAAGNWCQKFSYDRWGNRLVAAKYGVGQGTSVLDPGAVSAGTNQVTGGNWHYNGRGDLDTDGDGRKYLYDAEGRLVATCGAAVALGSCNALDAGGTWEARYVYDGNGKRVRRDTQVGGVVTTVVWGYDAGGKMVAEYGVGEGLGGVQYVTADHLGSTRVVTDGGGMGWRD